MQSASSIQKTGAADQVASVPAATCDAHNGWQVSKHLFFSFTRAAFSAALSCTVSCMGAADAAACPPPPPPPALLPLLPPLCVCAMPPLPLPCPLSAGPIGACRHVPRRTGGWMPDCTCASRTLHTPRRDAACLRCKARPMVSAGANTAAEETFEHYERLTGCCMPGRGGRYSASGGCFSGSVPAGMYSPAGSQLIGAMADADEALAESGGGGPPNGEVPP